MSSVDLKWKGSNMRITIFAAAFAVSSSTAFAQFTSKQELGRRIPPGILAQYDQAILAGERPNIQTITLANIWTLGDSVDSSVDAVRFAIAHGETVKAHMQTLKDWIQRGGTLLLWGYTDCNLLSQFGVQITYGWTAPKLAEHPVNAGCGDLNFQFRSADFQPYFGMETSTRCEVIVSCEQYVLAGILPFGKGRVVFVSKSDEEDDERYWNTGKDKDRWTLNLYQWMLNKPIPGAPQVARSVAQLGPSEGQAPKIETPCKYRFYNVNDEKEIEATVQTIRRFAKDGRVSTGTGKDAHGEYQQYDFVLSGVEQISELNSVLPYQTIKKGNETQTSLLYEEFGPQYSTNFRTVTLSGAIEIIVRFSITPGAKLYYSMQPGREVPVPATQIDRNGNVALNVRISRSQQYIYARSLLGKVSRYLRINIETGAAEEIARDQYQKR